MGGRITSRHIGRARFGRALWGYRPSEVKLLTRQMLRAVQRIERAEIPRLTADDVDGAAFGMRVLGYRTERVDDLLDQVSTFLAERGPSFIERRPPQIPPLTATKVHRARFRRGWHGYRVESVAALVARAAEELDRLEAGLATSGLTPEEVNLTSFEVGWRGYRQADVDAFLDHLAASLEGWRRGMGRARA